MSCCISLFAEPSVGKAQVGKLEENLRSRRNRRHVMFLSLGWCSSPTTDHNVAARAFQVELIYVYRTKVAHGVHRDTHVWCCMRSQLLHNHVFINAG